MYGGRTRGILAQVPGLGSGVAWSGLDSGVGAAVGSARFTEAGGR